ncbi:MAG: hypothetical protein FWE99_05630, partial [Bacteroidales bacterium]|nr:hypothetical protein [Bacteroidales bacterium]
MRIIANTLFLVAVLALTTSCIKDRFPSTRIDDDGAVLFLRLSTPGSYSGPNTRGLTFAEENTIDNIYVLVFNHQNQLVAIRQGLGITSSPGHSDPAYSGEGSFVVSVMPSKSVSDTYRLVVLANAASILNTTIGFDVEAVTNKAYAQVMAAIHVSITGKMYAYPAGSGGRIPMWGESGTLV